MKVDFIFTLPTAHNDFDNLNWYHRDAKRIKGLKSWSSGVYKKTQDGKYIIEIMNKNGSSEYWVVSMYYNKTNNTTRITPLGKVKRMFPSGNGGYFHYTIVH